MTDQDQLDALAADMIECAICGDYTGPRRPGDDPRAEVGARAAAPSVEPEHLSLCTGEDCTIGPCECWCHAAPPSPEPTPGVSDAVDDLLLLLPGSLDEDREINAAIGIVVAAAEKEGRDAAVRERDELREALEPFASAFDRDRMPVTANPDYQRASAALHSKDGASDE